MENALKKPQKEKKEEVDRATRKEERQAERAEKKQQRESEKAACDGTWILGKCVKLKRDNKDENP